ncbi:MAG: hypothetical protein H6738_05695 [Alphaproteobacteria bacterium]|nr:hypothetical protein [Alphaproteobacteria bacterium]MCB9696262.1 hypothetical protein [Alphaproteobacteria bacterium]
MTPFWKAAVTLVGATQLLLMVTGLWLASDLYEWARWAQENPASAGIVVSDHHPGYFETSTGMSAATLLVAWAVGGGVLLGLTTLLGGRESEKGSQDR